jgi:hypothetical protein
VKLSYELIDKVELNLIVVKENGNGEYENDENEERVDPIIVLITRKRINS